MGLLARIGLRRRELVGWALYDWANSAVWVTVITAVFPAFFVKFAAADLPEDVAAERFAHTTTIALALAAVLSPLLGAMADFSGARKRWLASFMLLGVGATAAMFFIGRGEWLFAAIAFGLVNLGAVGSQAFYDSLLPHIARADELDRVSSAGYSLGYLGGGLLLALNLAWIQHPEWFGLPAGENLSESQSSLPARLAFLSVAVWWAVFSLPLFRWVREPPRVLEIDETGEESALRVAWVRLRETTRELSRFRQAVLFMLAFFAYSDGIGTVIRMSTLLGARVGIDQGALIGAVLMVQFLGFPCALLFGKLAAGIGAKRGILIGVAMYLLVTLLAWRMRSTADFWVMAFLIALVQGGTQALSRSLFATLVPRHKSAEFFGLFATLEKFAGILGPLVFALVLGITGSTAAAVLSVAPFFLIGAVLLLAVDVGAGQRVAREAERDSTRPPAPAES